MLKVNNLTVYLKNKDTKKYLLKDICFALDKGDSLGIIGKSGEGKSTLAKALLEIYDNDIYPESSNISIDNQAFCSSFRGKKISIIFQNPNSYLNPLMKIGKQIDEMLIYHYKETKKGAQKMAIEMMRKVNLPNPERLYHYYPYEISGGMQQKVCLCIALICNPEILIIDEGTSYLDSSSKLEILNLIKKFQEDRKFSLIMISHDLNEIYSMCDKIALLRKGQMVEFGNKDEIILNSIHPYTLEILYDYLRFYQNLDDLPYPVIEEKSEEVEKITMVSQSHYVRYHFSDKIEHTQINKKTKEIRERIYENLRNN